MIDEYLIKIKKYSPEDILDRGVYNKIEKAVEIYWQDYRLGEAKELWKILLKLIEESEVSRKNIEFYQKYLLLLKKLGWIALHLLPDREVENFLKNDLLIAIRFEIDLIEKIKMYLNLVPDIEFIKQRRNLILQSLKNNNELIGSKNLVIEGLEGEYEPIIKNWLRDYDLNIAEDKRVNQMGPFEYLNANQNAFRITAEEKNYLRVIFEVYDYVRYITTNIQVEETEHKINNLLKQAADKNIKFKENQSRISKTEQEILAAYAGAPGQQKAITSEEEKLKKADKFKLRQEFMSSVQDKNTNRTIACFKLLAQTGDLGDFLKEDAKLNKFLANVWEKRFGQALAAEFLKEASQPKFVRMFLRYVLQERLGLTESEAARVGAQLGNIFVNLGKKEYNRIAYYDVGSKGFRWFSE